MLSTNYSINDDFQLVDLSAGNYYREAGTRWRYGGQTNATIMFYELGKQNTDAYLEFYMGRSGAFSSGSTRWLAWKMEKEKKKKKLTHKSFNRI